MDRLEIVGGVPFVIREQHRVVSFDGGVRELPTQPPRVEWERDLDDRAWQTVELEDGADLMFAWLCDREGT